MFPVAAVRTGAITATGPNLTDTDPAQVVQDEILSRPSETGANRDHDLAADEASGTSSAALAPMETDMTPAATDPVSVGPADDPDAPSGEDDDSREAERYDDDAE